MRKDINIDTNPDLKKNPFSVPQGYFDSLEQNIRDKVSTQNRVSFVTIIKPYLAVAASFCLIFGLGWGFVTFFGDRTGDNINEGIEVAIINEGFLKNSFVDFLYDELDLSPTIEVSDKLIEEVYESISIITKDLSDEEIYELIAQM